MTKSPKLASFLTRLASGVVLVILILGLLIFGGDVLLVSLALISEIGLFELYRVMKFEKEPLAFVCYAWNIAYYVLLKISLEASGRILALVILGMVLVLAVYVLTFPKYKADQVMAAFFGLFYVSIMLSYVYQTRMVAGGAYLVWLIFLCSWGCDTCAYCAGITMGKHKMSPILSPKKTIEGAFGGVLGAVLLSAIFALVFKAELSFGNPLLACMVITFAGSLISMIGDLAASAIKRDREIKDYGTLIPGHGGILDRFDSVIFTAPIIYYTVMFFLH